MAGSGTGKASAPAWGNYTGSFPAFMKHFSESNKLKFVILIGEKSHWKIKGRAFILLNSREQQRFAFICFRLPSKDWARRWKTKPFC
jgi:hypothetical protein